MYVYAGKKKTKYMNQIEVVDKKERDKDVK